MHGEGEVDRGRSDREGVHLTFRGEHVDLVGVDLEQYRVEELRGVFGFLAHHTELVHGTQPGFLGSDPVAQVFLVLPVRRDAVLGPTVHFVGADLQLDGFAPIPEHGGVQGLVHVELRVRDVVLEPARDRLPLGVRHPEHAVTVPHVVHQHPQPDEVVDVCEVTSPDHHLLVDRVEVLGAAVDGRFDLVVRHQLLELRDQVPQVAFPSRCLLRHQIRDLRVDLGFDGLEGQVLQFPLHGVHAQPMGQRGEDVEGFRGDPDLFVGAEKTDGPHVVKTVREFDHQDPHLLGGGHDHLPDGFRLRGFPVGHLVQFRDPVDHPGHLVGELLTQLLEGVLGVLDGVVQQSSDQHGFGHAQLCEDGGHRQRVGDVGITGLAFLPPVQLLRRAIGVLDQ